MARPPARTAALMATAEDVEAEFYEAMQLGDLDRMMAVWADDDEIACVHPGGPRLLGPQAVRAGFEGLFQNGGVQIGAHQVRRLQLGSAALHHVLERVRIGSDDLAEPWGYVLVTNVYVQTPRGWRMVLHHASPGQARELQEIADLPKGALH